jgi:ArsR family transcriptional regulator
VENLREGVWGFYHAVRSGPGREFINAVRYLFEADPAYAADISRAARVMEERKRRTLQFFDTVAPRWDLFKAEILGGFDLSRAVLRNAGTYGVGVDLGCGTGDLLEPMKQHADKVIGVDSSPRMLDEARKRFIRSAPRIEVRLGEIEHLPLGDGEADFAVISLVLQYLAKPAAAMAEVRRILKNGGHFVLAEFEKHDQEILRGQYGARWLGFSRAEVENWLTANRFAVQAAESYPLQNGLRLNVYSAAAVS